jgi:uncharacterized repeat protein (TIGR03803 family)
MPSPRLSVRVNRARRSIVTLILLATSCSAATEKQLHSFLGNGKDGNYPYAGVIMDSGGNLFGTTYQGGASGDGVVFELSPPAAGHSA